MSKPKQLKESIKEQLAHLLSPEATEPPSWQMQALKLGITFLAVEAKLEESEYGGFFDPDTPSLPAEPKGEEPPARKRKGRPPANPNDRTGSDGADSLFRAPGGGA